MFHELMQKMTSQASSKAQEDPAEDGAAAGGGLIKNARILRTTVHGDESHVVLSKGSNEGIAVGATDTITIGGKPYPLTIIDVAERTSTGRVPASPDVLQRTDRVQLAGDESGGITAKILRTTVKGSDSHVVLSKGTDDGVVAPTTGHIKVGGKSYPLSIHSSADRNSTGTVAGTSPEVFQGPHAVTIDRAKPAAE